MLEEPLDVGHMFRMVPQTLFMDGKPDAKVNLVHRRRIQDVMDQFRAVPSMKQCKAVPMLTTGQERARAATAAQQERARAAAEQERREHVRVERANKLQHQMTEKAERAAAKTKKRRLELEEKENAKRRKAEHVRDLQPTLSNPVQ